MKIKEFVIYVRGMGMNVGNLCKGWRMQYRMRDCRKVPKRMRGASAGLG